MAIVALEYAPVYNARAMTLEEYARFVDIDECAFFGVRGPNYSQTSCRDIWSFQQRHNFLWYLLEAQEEIEDEVGYLLSPEWVVGQLSDEYRDLERYVDSQTISYGNPLKGNYGQSKFNSRWNKIIAPGIRTVTDIALAEVVDQTGDPAIVGPIALASNITDVNEIHVFYPDTDTEINPSSITISGVFPASTVTIEIPKCRMVAFDKLNNPKQGWDYNDVATFQTTVDVKWIYNTTTTQVIMKCKSDCDCGQTTKSGCLRITNNRLGTIKPEFDNNLCGCCSVDNIGFYYLCGDINITVKVKEIIMRLAHSKMATEPCGCDAAQKLWRRDRAIPASITKERAECPFGLNDGAWIAWQWAKTLKHARFGSL